MRMDRSLDKAEDLLADATALVERVKVALPAITAPFVFGFRQNGALSLFFESEVAYHFNRHNQLRRVFLYGKRYKAGQGKLMHVTRIPLMRRVRLESAALEPGLVEEVLSGLNQRLKSVADLLNAGQFRIVEQVPDHGDIVSRLQNCIPELLHNQVAQTPHVDG